MNLERVEQISANVHAAIIAAQIGFSFDKTNKEAQQWARKYSADLVTQITNETREGIRKIMGRAFRTGLPPRQAAKLIQQIVGLNERQMNAVLNAQSRMMDATPGSTVSIGKTSMRVPGVGFSAKAIQKAIQQYSKKLLTQRGLAIARTETIAASNEGQRQLWKQAVEKGHLSGDELRVWITTEGACPICQPLNGQLRRLDEPFTTKVGPKMGPPAHTSCRCGQGLTDIEAGTPLTDRQVMRQPSSAYPEAESHAETFVRYTLNGEFTPERQRLHQAIVNAHFEGGLTPVDDPISTVLGGGPASGKTTVVKKLPAYKNTVHVDVDHIRTFLPEYREGLAVGDAAISLSVHEEAGYVSKLITDKAALDKFNMLIDGTGDSSYQKLSSKIQKYRAGGARVVGQYVTVDTETAVARSESRRIKTGRAVPESYLREVHKSISSVLPHAMIDGLYDEVILWDTNGKQVLKVASAIGKKITVHNKAAWERFIAKAHE